MMHVGNSAFFQKPPKNKLQEGLSVAEAQLAKLHIDIATQPPNMATFVGYGAKDMMGTTSGQMTHLEMSIDPEEMYASWIGQSLGIGVSGGYILLINEPDLLLALSDGWKYYRKYLVNTPHVKGRQIETWNGQWLCHILGRNFDPNFPEDNLRIETVAVQGNVSIPTVEWSKVIFALCRKFAKTTDLQTVVTAYAYNLSQTNTTLGFINLFLYEVQRIYEIRSKIFLDQKETLLSNAEIEELKTFFDFRKACMKGTIGLKALEPTELRRYMPKGTAVYAQGRDFQFKDETSIKTYQ
ncbi:MAG: hypothetical protein AAFR59_15635, partial [Bacteroidota bacterium]